MIKVGDRFKTIRGEEYVVVEYKNNREVTVEFCDDHKYRLTTEGKYIKTGQIKKPLFSKNIWSGLFWCG